MTKPIAQQAANPRDEPNDVRRRTGVPLADGPGGRRTTLYGSLEHGDQQQAIPQCIVHRDR
jgi:hypothetical protein